MLSAVRPAVGEGSLAGPPDATEAAAIGRYLGHNAGLAELTKRRPTVEMSGGSRRTKRIEWRGVAAMQRGLRQRSMLGHLHKPGGFRRPTMAMWAAGALAGALAVAGCAAGLSPSIGHTPTSGGTVTYALPANNTPNYIFPLSPIQYFTQVNSDNLQYLLYRPLYWFGGKGLPYLNSELSLAEPPTYNGQIVTIRLKPNYRWSDGESVNAQDVVFWMHMMKAVVKRSTSSVNWGGYVPGYFPDNVRNIRAVGSYEVKMTIIGHYSTQWFTYNELSQVSPMP